MKSKTTIIHKDDSSMFEIMRREKARRRALGIPEPLADLDAAIAEWKASHQANEQRCIFTIIIRPDNKRFYAYCPALPGCRRQGRTPEEAKARLTEALHQHLADLAARGEPLPQDDVITDIIEVSVPAMAR